MVKLSPPGQETEEERFRLTRIHVLRMQAHWGKGYDLSQTPWPQTIQEWRQTPYGAPWDTNVHMARWHYQLALQIQAEGLLE